MGRGYEKEITAFHVLTLFPEMVDAGLRSSIIGRAAEKDIISLDIVNIRDYTIERHGRVDDYSYGGGAGMLMQAQPVFDAHRAVTAGRAVRTIYVTPQGIPFSQKYARELSKERELVILCGHYEGIDERVLEEIVTDYISIGDYVLTGGELAAMVMIDAVSRLIPGVLGNELSAEEESFDNDLLEYPQYSRPEVWHGKRVPEVLLTGNHSKITAWRLEQAKVRTAERRPDLYERYQTKQLLVKQLSREKRNHIHIMESLSRGRGEILYVQDDQVAVYDREAAVCMLEAESREAGERLVGMIPADAGLVVTSRPFVRDILMLTGYLLSGEYRQVLYTRRETLPVRYKEIRRLILEDLDDVFDHYLAAKAASLPGITRAYLRERIHAGAMWGAVAEGSLAGFVGVHREGSLGMLYVEENFRGQGIGQSLEAYAVNRMLERGFTPYGYVAAGNFPSEHLQEKLGFYKAEKKFWWLEKVLANPERVC